MALRLIVRALAAVGLFSTALGGCVVNGQPAGGKRGGAFGDGGGDAAFRGPFDAGSCAPRACPVLECPATFRGVALPGECCPTLCEPSDCSTVDCAPIDCAPGTHSAKPSGLCCPTCVKDTAPVNGETCDQGQTGYQSFYDQTVATIGATFCSTDSECRIVVLSNACSQDCGTAIAARAATDLKTRLDAYAAAHCGACTAQGSACPPVERFAFCTGGVCSAH